MPPPIPYMKADRVHGVLKNFLISEASNYHKQHRWQVTLSEIVFTYENKLHKFYPVSSYTFL